MPKVAPERIEVCYAHCAVSCEVGSVVVRQVSTGKTKGGVSSSV